MCAQDHEERYSYQIYFLIKYKTTYFNYKFMHIDICTCMLFLFQFSFNFSFVFLHKDQGSLLPFFWPVFIMLQNRSFIFKTFHIPIWSTQQSPDCPYLLGQNMTLLLLYPPFFLSSDFLPPSIFLLPPPTLPSTC